MHRRCRSRCARTRRSAFIDTNILVYHLLQNDAALSPRCTRFLGMIEIGEFIGHISESVVVETIHVIHKGFGAPRVSIAQNLAALIALPGIVCPQKDVVLHALALWVEEPPLSFPDCLHLLHARDWGLDAIYTFDKKMNRLPGVTRVEP